METSLRYFKNRLFLLQKFQSETHVPSDFVSVEQSDHRVQNQTRTAKR